MTYTFKLARRLARLRSTTTLLLPIIAIIAACSGGEPTGITPVDTPAGTEPAQGPVVVSPRKVTIESNQKVLFKAFESLAPNSSQVTSVEWTASGGTIKADGSYLPSATGTFKVVGKRKGNPNNPPDTATVTVVPPASATLVAVIVTPSTATVGIGLQQQFTAVGRQSDSTTVAIGATWTATGGTIDAGGLYTAGSTAGTYKVIATHAASGLADTAVVTVPAATLASISMTPATVSLTPGQAQQFSVTARMSDGSTASSLPVTYTATGGTISTSGLYTAGSAAGSFRVIATAQGKADTSAITIAVPPTLSSVVLSPGTVSLTAGQSQQFSATGKMSDGSTSLVAVTYSATGGTITSGGVYTAGSTTGAFRVIATAQTGQADTSSVSITALTAGSVLLNADFESGTFPSGTGVIKCTNGVAQIYSNDARPAGAPAALVGTHALKLYARTDELGCGGTVSTRFRTQIEFPKPMLPGKDYWLAWAQWLPADTPTPTSGGHLSFYQIYNQSAGTNPMVSAVWYDGKVHITNNFLTSPLIGVLDRPTQTWTKYLMHYLPSTDPSKGYIEMWYSPTPTGAVQPVKPAGCVLQPDCGCRVYGQTMESSWANAGPFLDVYGTPSYFPSVSGITAYFDEVKVGTTRQSVEIVVP